MLQVKLWVGAGGWNEVEALEATVAAQRQENAKLEQRTPRSPRKSTISRPDAPPSRSARVRSSA